MFSSKSTDFTKISVRIDAGLDSEILSENEYCLNMANNILPTSPWDCNTITSYNVKQFRYFAIKFCCWNKIKNSDWPKLSEFGSLAIKC